MAYLKNSTVNLLNLHYGLQMLALNGAGVFFFVFLLRAGVPAAAVFIWLALALAGRFAIRPLVLILAPHWGLRALVIFGTVASGVQYLFLAEVHGIDFMLLGLCLTSAIGDAFYWTTYHAYFAALGDAEHRGHQVGAREALASITAIVAPLAGGLVLTALGPRIAFGAAMALHALAALPFLATPDVKVVREMPGAFKAAIPGILLFVADGWSVIGYMFVWQIALFLSLGESFSSFGVAMAVAALVGAISGLILGRHIDAGHGNRVVWFTFAALAAATMFRAVSTGDATLAVAANAFGALVGCFYIPTLMTAVYNLAKRSPCALRFHLAAEGGWDIGGAAASLFTALLIAAGLSLSFGILLSLAGQGLALFLLRRYYAGMDIVPRPPVTQPLPGA